MNGDKYRSTYSEDKSVCRCEQCNAFLIFDSAIEDQNGKCIAFDLNHKRHFCSAADKIEHECQVVETAIRYVSQINRTELTSFKLELLMGDCI
jgi:hypothetical protein